MRSIRERLLSKVQKTSHCWQWLGGVSKDGYGKMGRGGRGGGTISAHRASWEVHRGKIPAGLFVCHKCDNKMCVNPEHLFIGSPKDNVADMMLKGRNGARVLHLSHEEAKEIRKKYSQFLRDMAAHYGVGHQVIYRVLTKKTWGHF